MDGLEFPNDPNNTLSKFAYRHLKIRSHRTGKVESAPIDRIRVK